MNHLMWSNFNVRTFYTYIHTNIYRYVFNWTKVNESYRYFVCLTVPDKLIYFLAETIFKSAYQWNNILENFSSNQCFHEQKPSKSKEFHTDSKKNCNKEIFVYSFQRSIVCLLIFFFFCYISWRMIGSYSNQSIRLLGKFKDPLSVLVCESIQIYISFHSTTDALRKASQGPDWTIQAACLRRINRTRMTHLSTNWNEAI